MAGSRATGIKAAVTNKLRHGEEYYKLIGKKGGTAGTGHAFAHGKVSPSIAGHIGGQLSIRGVKQTKEELEYRKALVKYKYDFKQKHSSWLKKVTHRLAR